MSPEDYTAEEQAQAQAELDFHPDTSAFWDSAYGQEMLRLAKVCALRPANTDRERRALYADARERAEAA